MAFEDLQISTQSSQANEVATGMEEPKTTSPPIVLIVGDDKEIRHALRLLFEFEDFFVAGEPSNGVDAICFAIRLRPDFVVIDHGMPRIDGEPSAEILRAVAPETRIVAFSAELTTRPGWADAYLNKVRISQVAPLLTALMPDVDVPGSVR